jgi:polysaccharide biosynthesis protein PslL
MQNKPGRNNFIDVAKAISIFLVILNHSGIFEPIQEVNRAFSSFRMPLFFMLSGVFFQPNRRFLHILQKCTESLLKPYYVTLTIAAVFGTFALQQNFWPRIFAMLHGTGISLRWPWSPLWFLPHLWLLTVVAAMLSKVSVFQYGNLKKNFSGLSFLFFLIPFTTRLTYEEPFISIFIFPEWFEKNGLPFSLEILPHWCPNVEDQR